MAITKLTEFAVDGEKNSDGLTETNGFPIQEKPARQWFNYLLNNITSKSNELTDSVNYLTEGYEAVKFDTGLTVTPEYQTQIERFQSDKNREIVSVKDFGAIGDGITDDTLAIQKCLDVAGNIYFPTSNYLISNTLKLKSDTTLFGYGANIKFNAVGDNPLIIASGDYNEEIALLQPPELLGGIDDQKTLVSVVSPHGLSVGDRVLIQSQRDAFSNDSKDWRLGTATGNSDSIYFSEIITVQSIVSPTSFYTTKQLEYPYYLPSKEAGVDLSPNARDFSSIRKINFAKNINILGFSVSGESTGTQSSANSFVFGFCESPLIRDVKIAKKNSHGKGIIFVNCWKGLAENCEVDNSNTYYANVDEAHVPDNHISFVNSWHCTAKGCGSLHAGQTFDTTYGSPDLQGVLPIRCPSTYINILDCFVDASLDNAVTNHSGSYMQTFDRCTFVGNARYVLIRSPYTTLSNSKIVFSQGNANTSAIYLQESTIQGCRIINNQIRGGDIAIRINPFVDRGEPPYQKSLNIEIRGNTLIDVNSALLVYPSQNIYETDGVTLTQYAKDSLNIVFDSNTVIQNTNSPRSMVEVQEFSHGVDITNNNLKSKKIDTHIRIKDKVQKVNIIGNKTNFLPNAYLTDAKLFLPNNADNLQLNTKLNTFHRYYDNSTNGARVAAIAPYDEIRNEGQREITALTETQVGTMKFLSRDVHKTVNVMSGSFPQATNYYVSERGSSVVGMFYQADDVVANSKISLLNNGIGVTLQDNVFKPNSDNAISLGRSGARWSVVYAASSTISTSDERLKTKFDSIKLAEKRAALKIKESIGRYQFTDSVNTKGKSARYHFGVGAQTVGKIMQDEGLEPEQYAFYCYDEWESEEELLGENGEVIQNSKEAGSRYGIRYEELIMFILAST